MWPRFCSTSAHMGLVWSENKRCSAFLHGWWSSSLTCFLPFPCLLLSPPPSSLPKSSECDNPLVPPMCLPTIRFVSKTTPGCMSFIFETSFECSSAAWDCKKELLSITQHACGQPLKLLLEGPSEHPLCPDCMLMSSPISLLPPMVYRLRKLFVIPLPNLTSVFTEEVFLIKLGQV